MAVLEAEWQARAKRLADGLVRSQALSDRGWYDAFATTPRHVFVPSFSVDGRRFEGSENVDAWLDAAYRDDALLTQTSGQRPTSSSSRPEVMAVMLSLLEITAGDRVLEIGTGTGYNTALLARRLGGEQITSIDIDSNLVDEAAARLSELGASPLLVTGDGFEGWMERAPYDRVIATCAVRQIPPAWIRQLRDGGRIVAPMTGPGSPLMVLVKTAPDEVTGHFDPRPALFMPLRHAADDPLGPGESVVFTSTGIPHYGTTALDPDLLADAPPGLALFCQFHLPGMAIGAEPGPDGSVVVHTADAMAEVRRTPLRAGRWQVVQRGPYRCWDTIEVAAAAWRELGQPAHDRLGITALDRLDRQFVWLDDPNGTHSWPLR